MSVLHRLSCGDDLGIGYGMVRGSNGRKVLVNAEFDEKLNDLDFNFGCNINRRNIGNNINGKENNLDNINRIIGKDEINNSSFNVGGMNLGGVNDMVRAHPPIQQQQQQHQQYKGVGLGNGLKVMRNGLIRHGVQVCRLGFFVLLFYFFVLFLFFFSLYRFFTRE